MLNRLVLLLNQNYEPVSIIRAKKAIVLIFLGKAEIVEKYDGVKIRSPSTEIPLPSIVRLYRYVNIHRREIPLTKKNVLKRDNYTCQYCGKRKGTMTVDHVIPKRLGGKDTWENLVCACIECNTKKGDRTPEEAGMKLLKKPAKPTYFQLLYSRITLPDEKWKQYLFLSS